jgi:hypothetical protein
MNKKSKQLPMAPVQFPQPQIITLAPANPAGLFGAFAFPFFLTPAIQLYAECGENISQMANNTLFYPAIIIMIPGLLLLFFHSRSRHLFHHNQRWNLVSVTKFNLPSIQWTSSKPLSIESILLKKVPIKVRGIQWYNLKTGDKKTTTLHALPESDNPQLFAHRLAHKMGLPLIIGEETYTPPEQTLKPLALAHLNQDHQPIAAQKGRLRLSQDTDRITVRWPTARHQRLRLTVNAIMACIFISSFFLSIQFIILISREAWTSVWLTSGSIIFAALWFAIRDGSTIVTKCHVQANMLSVGNTILSAWDIDFIEYDRQNKSVRIGNAQECVHLGNTLSRPEAEWLKRTIITQMCSQA